MKVVTHEENDHTEHTNENLARALQMHCSSALEAAAIADAILEDCSPTTDGSSEAKSIPSTGSNSTLFREAFTSAIETHLGASRDIAEKLLEEVFPEHVVWNDAESVCTPFIEDKVSPKNGVDNYGKGSVDADEDGLFIGEGRCEMCEREIALTRHHLIPRSTHAKMKVKFLHAIEATQRDDIDKAAQILGPGLDHMIEAATLLEGDKSLVRSAVRQMLFVTCNICRMCHTVVHSTHDNMTLALEFNTVDKILSDKNIYKFCKWASKQKPGKFSVSKNKK
mmetsp:Transcript_30477/g.69783  ORF Transcript_30477/g.69783 Transcript_30477/m.69783 type:complete len:280 (-) Transcript_30477:431-1270(-)